MHEMSDVGQRLQRDLGAVEGAAAGRAARLELLGAALFTFASDFLVFLPQPGSLKLPGS